jgi:hypothetical protein
VVSEAIFNVSSYHNKKVGGTELATIDRRGSGLLTLRFGSHRLIRLVPGALVVRP